MSVHGPSRHFACDAELGRFRRKSGHRLCATGLVNTQSSTVRRWHHLMSERHTTTQPARLLLPCTVSCLGAGSVAIVKQPLALDNAIGKWKRGMQWKLTRPYSPALWPDMSSTFLDLSEFEFDG